MHQPLRHHVQSFLDSEGKQQFCVASHDDPGPSPEMRYMFVTASSLHVTSMQQDDGLVTYLSRVVRGRHSFKM